MLFPASTLLRKVCGGQAGRVSTPSSLSPSEGFLTDGGWGGRARPRSSAVSSLGKPTSVFSYKALAGEKM
ncbi:hypothetical protein HYR65_00720 [Candidatus Azambacteria bacterium]|nr:hypothetical protein [Candidatus Azambacteria bacterium]